MNGDLPNVGKGDGLLNRQTLKDVSGVGTHNAQLFDNEDDYFEKLASRMNGDLPNVGKGDGLLNRQTLKDVSGVGTHNLRIVFLSF